MAQNPEWYSGTLVASAGGLITAAGDDARHRGHLTNYDRVTGIRGLTLRTNSATQVTLDCDMVSLRSAAGKNVVASPSSLTCDISVAGPAVNGRDQAGAFSANSWVSIYYIYAPGTIRTIASALHTHAGPAALPATYTHWAYITTLRLDSAGNFRPVQGEGHLMLYDWDDTGSQVTRILSAGVATTFTAVDASALVPPISRLALVDWAFSFIHNTPETEFGAFSRLPGSAAATGRRVLRLASTLGFSIAGESLPVMLTNSRTLEYRINPAPSGAGGLYLDIAGYVVPNGAD